MGKFKDVGEPSLVLMEELAEAIQVIAKKHRFQEDWDSFPPSDINSWPKKTRWQLLQEEMEDVLYQWERLKEQHNNP
jgi:NTP pyrophosphatase (non-canonical NTP hydrolase)